MTLSKSNHFFFNLLEAIVRKNPFIKNIIKSIILRKFKIFFIKNNPNPKIIENLFFPDLFFGTSSTLTFIILSRKKC